MKAERRHELKTNTLASVLMDVNIWLRKHGGKLLLIVAVIALAAILWNNRRLRQNSDRIGARQAVVSVRRAIENWSRSPATPDQIQLKRDGIDAISKSIADDIFNKSDEPKVLAQAFLLEGDLNWAVASWPEYPGAATQPGLIVDKDHAARLKQAKDAYQRVVDQFPELSGLVAQAHLNLGAVAENSRDWAEATAQYKAVIEDKNAPAVFVDLARRRAEDLPNLQKAAYLAPIAPPATEETTFPSTSGPTTR